MVSAILQPMIYQHNMHMLLQSPMQKYIAGTESLHALNLFNKIASMAPYILVDCIRRPPLLLTHHMAGQDHDPHGWVVPTTILLEIIIIITFVTTWNHTLLQTAKVTSHHQSLQISGDWYEIKAHKITQRWENKYFEVSALTELCCTRWCLLPWGAQHGLLI